MFLSSKKNMTEVNEVNFNLFYVHGDLLLHNMLTMDIFIYLTRVVVIVLLGLQTPVHG